MPRVVGAKLGLEARPPPQDSRPLPPPQLAFFHIREDDKPSVLLHLLRNVVRPQDQTVVFVATKHHAEYLKEVSRVDSRASQGGWREMPSLSQLGSRKEFPGSTTRGHALPQQS